MPLLKSVEKKIFENIRKSVGRHRNDVKSSERTENIKRELRKLARENNCVSYPSRTVKKGSQRKRRRREWLYDFCWGKEGKGKNGWKKFKGLKLIAEIEWKKGRDEYHLDNILEDFQKLTVGIATYRLFVLGYGDSEKSIYNEKWLKSAIKECAKIKSDGKFRYLIIAIPKRKKENVRCYLIKNNKYKEFYP